MHSRMAWEPGFQIFIHNLLFVFTVDSRYAYYNTLCSSVCKCWALSFMNCCWLLVRRAIQAMDKLDMQKNLKLITLRHNWEGCKRVISVSCAIEQQTTEPTCVLSQVIQDTNSRSDHTCFLTVFLPPNESILCTFAVRDQTERASCVTRAQAHHFSWPTQSA